MDIKGTSSFKPSIQPGFVSPGLTPKQSQEMTPKDTSTAQSPPAFTQDSTSTGIQGKMVSLSQLSKSMSESGLTSDPKLSSGVMKHLTEIAMPLLGSGFAKEDAGEKQGQTKNTQEGQKSAAASGSPEGSKGMATKKPFSRLDDAKKLINKEFTSSAMGKGGLDSLRKTDMKQFMETRQAAVSGSSGGGPSQEQLRVAIRNAASAIWDILKKARKAEDKEDTTSGILGVLMKIHSAYTFEHSNRVMDLTMGLAEELGINDEQQLENLKNAAFFKDIGQYGPDGFSYLKKDGEGDILNYIRDIKNSLRECGNLHDIGKMRIPDTILNKNSKLNDEEFAQIKKHPMIGVEIVLPYPALHGALPGIRHHHEKWDGYGYPDRISGLAIPLQARIIAICDTFDAMTEDRPYRKALTADMAVKELIRCSGTQFDPTLVPAFIYALAKKGEINISLYENDIKMLEEKFNFKAKPQGNLNFKIKDRKGEE